MATVSVPEIDPGGWRLQVHGMVERELSMSLETLREAFRERTVTATLQCAGNRRAGLIAIRDIPGEAPWGPGATGTATWTGVALGDVLTLAGPHSAATDVGFEGADPCPETKPVQRFGGSIPLDKARRSEVLLAWAMNGEPLAPVHGAPLRVVVPAISAHEASSGSSASSCAQSRGQVTSSTSCTGWCPPARPRDRVSGCRSAW